MISVILTAYNAEKYIQQAIESIINQTYKDWELIVVEDGSTDGTFEKLMDSRWKDDYNLSDLNMVIVRSAENVGHTKSLNKALMVAKGEYIAWQDADDISEPHRFEEQLKCFTKNVGIVTTCGIAINDNGDRVKDWYCDKGQRRTELEIKINSETDWWCMGPSMMFKREVVEKIGGFDEECYYCQDYNFWLRTIEEFDWKVCGMELYRLRRHKGSVRKNKKAGEKNWGTFAYERAKICPIVK